MTKEEKGKKREGLDLNSLNSDDQDEKFSRRLVQD